jgi:hypothetical protein
MLVGLKAHGLLGLLRHTWMGSKAHELLSVLGALGYALFHLETAHLCTRVISRVAHQTPLKKLVAMPRQYKSLRLKYILIIRLYMFIA